MTSSAPSGAASDGPAERNPSAMGAALAPLRERYDHWLRLSETDVARDREEAAEDVRAMQIVLRLERAEPPSWHRAVASAAAGAAAICLDPRADPGGEWYPAIRDYCIGHIRKVTRRARAGHWAAAQDLPGITLRNAGTEIRVLLPGLVGELDGRISRLQVGGTDVPVDGPPEPSAEPVGALRLWVPARIGMTVGKAMAQSGHAGMILAALLAGDGAAGLAALGAWRDAGYPVTIRRVEDPGWAEVAGGLADQAAAWREQGLLAVRDAGFTEVAPGTITCIATDPDERPR